MDDRDRESDLNPSDDSEDDRSEDSPRQDSLPQDSPPRDDSTCGDTPDDSTTGDAPDDRSEQDQPAGEESPENTPSPRGEPLSPSHPSPSDAPWEGIADERLVVEIMLAHAPIIVWEIDRDGFFTLSRGHGLEELQLESDQVVGTSAFHHYRDFPDIIADLTRALAGAQFKSLTQVDGRHFETTYTPVRDADGSVRSVVGVSTVVTGQRLAELDRDQNRRRLEAITSVVPVGLFVSDSHGGCVEANENLCQLTGMTQEELLGYGWLRSIHPDDQDRINKRWQEALARDGCFREEQRFVRPDGSIVYAMVNAVPEKDAEGNRRHYVGAVTDITAYKEEVVRGESILQEQIQRRSETFDKLREMDGRFQTVLENAPDYILEIMLDGTIRSINRTIPPLRKSDVEGKTIYDFVAPELHDRERARYRRIIETHLPSHWETESRSPDGRVAIYLSRAAPVIRGDKVVSFIVISTDVTDQRRAEQEAAQRRDEVAHLSRISAMCSMAASIVHELTKPLNNISFKVGPLIQKNDDLLSDPERVRELLCEIHEDVVRSEEMIKRLRGFANNQTLERVSCAPSTLMKEAHLQAVPFIRKSRTELHIEIEPDLRDVYADLILIEQVLVNLMQNAVEAMENIPIDERNIFVTVRRVNADFVEFAIRDTGPGLPEGFDLHNFKAFNTTKSLGMGIGLSNSQETVTKHGGKLWAETAAGSERGATFRMTLPVSQENDSHEQ